MFLQPLLELTAKRSLVSRQLLPRGGVDNCHSVVFRSLPLCPLILLLHTHISHTHITHTHTHTSHITHSHTHTHTHSESAFLGALSPLQFLQLLLVLLDHVGQTLHILVGLLQQVDQPLVLLLVNQLSVALLVLSLVGMTTDNTYLCVEWNILGTYMHNTCTCMFV